MTSPHPVPARHLVGLGALWFGLFGAAAAWSVQEVVSFAVVSHSCYPDWRPRAAPTVAGTWTIALVVGLVMLALGVSAAATAWRSWRRSEEAGARGIAHQLEVGERRVHFMATSGLVVSGLILFTILLNLLVLFMAPICGGVP
jgi:uncharacterized membrane protein YidH (DUF202 family)